MLAASRSRADEHEENRPRSRAPALPRRNGPRFGGRPPVRLARIAPAVGGLRGRIGELPPPAVRSSRARARVIRSGRPGPVARARCANRLLVDEAAALRRHAGVAGGPGDDPSGCGGPVRAGGGLVRLRAPRDRPERALGRPPANALALREPPVPPERVGPPEGARRERCGAVPARRRPAQRQPRAVRRRRRAGLVARGLAVRAHRPPDALQRPAHLRHGPDRGRANASHRHEGGRDALHEHRHPRGPPGAGARLPVRARKGWARGATAQRTRGSRS